MATLSDEELRAKLTELGVDVGPIDSNTRKTYQKKLDRLINNKTTPKKTPKRNSRKTRSSRRTIDKEENADQVVKNTSPTRAQTKTIQSEERVTSTVSRRALDANSSANRSVKRPVVITRIKETFSSDDDGLAVQHANLQTTAAPYPETSKLVAQKNKVDQWLNSGKQIIRRNLMSDWVKVTDDDNAGNNASLNRSSSIHQQQTVTNPQSFQSSYQPADIVPFLYLLLIVVLLVAFARIVNDSKQYKVLPTDIPKDKLSLDLGLEEYARILTHLLKGIHKQSSKYDCSRGATVRWITWRQATDLVNQAIPNRYTQKGKNRIGNETIQDILVSFKELSGSFPDWCISVIEGNDENVTCDFQSCRSANFGCVLWKLIRNTFYLVLIVAVVVIPSYTYYMWSQAKERAKKRWSIELFKLVDRIIEVVRTHYFDSMNSGDALPYVAISHVRDILIPPAQRQRKRKLWNDAANFVSMNDSRVRLESQRIAGEDFEVWRWTCQSSPALNTKFKSLYSNIPIEKDSEVEQLAVPGIGFKVWQGQINYTNTLLSRTIENNENCCLKLENMFDSENEAGNEWMKRVYDAILEKCADSCSIVHIYVERYSNRGSVYIKCRQVEDAKETFKATHGCVFDGRIVRARFINDRTYHSLFPDAANSSEPLKPSDDSMRSMIFLAEANIYLN